MQLRQALPVYSNTLKQRARKALNLAADWAVNVQIRDSWPAWNSNKGRFPYHILINAKKRAAQPQVWSTCWKTARTAQGLYCAYLVTQNQKHLAAANLANEYMTTLQFFEPGYEDFHGAFREDSTQGPHIASRDGMEAIQGFIAGYLATKNARYLRRAVEGSDFLLRAMKKGWFPFGIAWPLEHRIKHQDAFCFYVGALVFAQMYALTKNKAYLKQGVIPMAENVLKKYVRGDGALGLEPKKISENSHHVISTGGLAGVYINDDGLGVAMLSAYAVTGNKKYRDAAVGFADYWARVEEDPSALAPYPATALFLADVQRLTGDKKYTPKITRFIEKTLELQYLNPKEPFLHGGFIGEDMAAHYDKTTKPKDYVDLRITSYALIALSKIAAHNPKQWGCAYSCFGW